MGIPHIFKCWNQHTYAKAIQPFLINSFNTVVLVISDNDLSIYRIKARSSVFLHADVPPPNSSRLLVVLLFTAKTWINEYLLLSKLIMYVFRGWDDIFNMDHEIQRHLAVFRVVSGTVIFITYTRIDWTLAEGYSCIVCSGVSHYREKQKWYQKEAYATVIKTLIVWNLAMAISGR